MVVVTSPNIKNNDLSHGRVRNRLVSGAVLAVMLMRIAACGSKDKEKSPGQSLVRVNGEEITVHQVNEELARANVPADRRDAATKQLLEALIDRQLLQSEAAHDKVDRDPAVVQAIERAKAQIVAQAYMQRRLAKVAKPTKEEIDKYYADHPDFFSERKAFELEQVVIATKDFNAELKAMMGPTKTLDDIVFWIKEHHIEFARGSTIKSTVELAPALVKKLKEMHKGQLFALQEGDRSVIVVIKNIKEDPAKLEVAQGQIGSFLFNQRNKEASEAEVARLRSTAKIEYLNKKEGDSTGSDKNDAIDKPKSKEENADHVKRGVADL